MIILQIDKPKLNTGFSTQNKPFSNQILNAYKENHKFQLEKQFPRLGKGIL